MAGGGKKKGLSVRGFAAELGITENAVRSRIKSGKRIAEAVLDDGSLDPDRARALWWVDLNTANIRGTKQDTPAIKDQAEEALRRATISFEAEEVQLRRDKIKLAKEEGNAIDLVTARKAMNAVGRAHRDATLSFAARQGPELASKWGVDPRAVVADLDAALRSMLEDLAAEPVPFEE